MSKTVVGQRITQLRKAQGLSLAELAAETGISVHTLSSYESGRRQPCWDAAVALERYFGVSGSYLRGEEDEPDDDTLPASAEPSRFPQVLKALRKARGLTQGELAATLGLSNATITAYETGLRVPTLPSVFALEQYFGVTAAALLGLEDANPAAPRADGRGKPRPLTDAETRLLEDFRCLSAENQTTLLRLAAKFAAIDKALSAWLDADEPC